MPSVEKVNATQELPEPHDAVGASKVKPVAYCNESYCEAKDEYDLPAIYFKPVVFGFRILYATACQSLRCFGRSQWQSAFKAYAIASRIAFRWCLIRNDRAAVCDRATAAHVESAIKIVLATSTQPTHESGMSCRLMRCKRHNLCPSRSKRPFSKRRTGENDQKPTGWFVVG